jgi:hypothetical protein
VLPCLSICPRMTHHPLTIVPALITSTVYNVYSRGSTSGCSTPRLWQIVSTSGKYTWV